MWKNAALLAFSSVALVAPLAHAVPAGAVDVTPMVYASDRDGDTEIYRLKGDGSTAQLTRNTAHDYAASWSPDGKRVAFVSDRDGDPEVFVMNADGSATKQLTRNSRTRAGMPIVDTVPAWSPDGKRLAFVSNRDGGEMEIYRMNADGTGQVRLTRTPAHVSNHTPSWSPGGHYIVFNSDRVGYDNIEIYRMRMNGTDVVRLTRTPAGVDDNSPRYSRDGRTIAFTSTRHGNQHDVFTMTSDGSSVKRIGGHPALDDAFPRFTSDGGKLLFETFPGPEGTPSQDIWSIRTDGTGRTQLTNTSANEFQPDPEPRR